MSRKRKKRTPRKIEADDKYSSTLVEEFIHKIMLKGKKHIARRIMYKAMSVASKKLNKPPMEVIDKAIKNVKPILEVKPRRVGGATYQVPVEVREKRAMDLAMRWLIQFAKIRKGKPMCEKLAEELVAAANNEGAAVKKRQDTHKMAEANRAFAHYRW